MRCSWIVFSVLLAPVVAPASELCLAEHPSFGNSSYQCVLGTEYENAWVGFSESGSPCQVTACDFTNYFYGWSVSSSATDPYENTSTLSDGLVYLHLWLVCAYDFLEAAAFRVVPSADMTFVTFEPAPGFLNGGTGQDLAIAAPPACTDYPVRVGAVLLFRDTVTSAAAGVEAESWGGAKARYR